MKGLINYCTLFDSAYLSRGLLMIDSLKATGDNIHLYVFAFDDLSCKILKALNPVNVTVISLAEFENDELLKVKSTRSRAEYCWTCTPSTIEYCFVRFGLDNCTYVDSDLFFYSPPSALIEEMISKGKNVLITDHRYSLIPKLRELKRAGRFCVQFITFINTEESRNILLTWRDQCLNWCFNRYEDGRFGDQKYLDEWPERYGNVHILENIGGGVAPWNTRRYLISLRDGKMKVKECMGNDSFDIVFYHFHFVRFIDDNTTDLGWNYLGRKVIRYIYGPYIRQLIDTERMLSSAFPEYKRTFTAPDRSAARERIKTKIKAITRFNVIRWR